MSSKPQFSKKILKILGEKSAVSVPELIERMTLNAPHPDPLLERREGNAIRRSIKGLQDAGLVENVHSGQNSYARLTKDGKRKANQFKLDDDTTLLNPNWDGCWRIVLLDIPEERKSEREALRYLLKKANFLCLKNSVWVSPYPFEHLFENIKADLGLTTELMILVTKKLDDITEQALYKEFRIKV
jgi:DNA-binding transcriptional regulator PaaX